MSTNAQHQRAVSLLAGWDDATDGCFLRIIRELQIISETYDYDFGPTPSSGLSPKKWKDWITNQLPNDQRCATCTTLNRGNHGKHCL
jgi:hypothetical protein